MEEFFDNFLYGWEIRREEVGEGGLGEDKVVKGRDFGVGGKRKEVLKWSSAIIKKI